MKHSPSVRLWFSMAFASLRLIAVMSVSSEAKSGDLAVLRSEAQYRPMPANVVGVVVMDPSDMLSKENRSGTQEGACFSYGGDSYRWFYVPPLTKAGEEYSFGIRGDSKERTRIPNLLLATRESLAEQGLTADYTLVDVTVNDGKGSSAEDSFAATEIKILDGSRSFPIRPESVLRKLTQAYQTEFKSRKDVYRSLDDLRKSVAKEVKAIGPLAKRLREAETTQSIYVTWLPKVERLHVELLSGVHDGYYVHSKGIVPAVKNTTDPGIRHGIEYGVETGEIYDISKSGEVVSTEAIRLKTYVTRIGLPGSPGKQPSAPAK